MQKLTSRCKIIIFLQPVQKTDCNDALYQAVSAACNPFAHSFNRFYTVDMISYFVFVNIIPGMVRGSGIQESIYDFFFWMIRL